MHRRITARPAAAAPYLEPLNQEITATGKLYNTQRLISAPAQTSFTATAAMKISAAHVCPTAARRSSRSPRRNLDRHSLSFPLMRLATGHRIEERYTKALAACQRQQLKCLSDYGVPQSARMFAFSTTCFQRFCSAAM